MPAFSVRSPHKIAEMDTEKIHDASSEDPEKMTELTPKATVGDGEVINEMLKHANPNDGDEALKAFQGHDGEEIVMTPEMEKKLLRKIDLNLMPVSNATRICSNKRSYLPRRFSVSFTV